MFHRVAIKLQVISFCGADYRICESNLACFHRSLVTFDAEHRVELAFDADDGKAISWPDLL
jgi:hypothetical protein